MIEAAVVAHAFRQHLLPGVSKRRMAQIVGKRDRFRQIFIQPQRTRDGATDRRHLDRMRQARSQMIAGAVEKDLRFVFQPPECTRMDDPRTVPLKFSAISVTRFTVQSAARFARFLSNRRERCALRLLHFALIVYPKCRGIRGLRLDPLDESAFQLFFDSPMKKRQTKKLTPARLQQFGFAYAPPFIISAAVNNKVFDTLEAGPKTVEQVKKQTGASARGLRVIMDALVGLELLKKDRQSRYSLTPESQAFLITEKPATLAGFFGSILPVMIPRWLRLTDVVRHGRPAVAVNQETEGTEFFSQLVETIIPMSYPC